MYRIIRISFFILALVIGTSAGSCKKKKDAELPELTFKSGSNYLSGNASVGQGIVFTVGVIADKTKRDLRKFEINYSYDGGGFTQFESHLMSSSEKDHFEKDVKITTRNEQGLEKWEFKVTDIDGNAARETISLSVN